MMICKNCGAEVPDDKLVCDCFQTVADSEAVRISLARFMAHEGWLFLMDAGDHLLPASKDSLTLCRMMKKSKGDPPVVTLRRFKRPKVSEVRRAQLQKPWTDRVCKECMAVVTAAAAEALAQSVAEEKPQALKVGR